MIKKKPVGVIVYGWIFIILAVLSIVLLPKLISSENKALSMLAHAPQGIKYVLLNLVAFATINFFITCPLFLITGIGVLKLRLWAYYAVLIILISIPLNLVSAINCYMGPQYIRPIGWLGLLLFCILSFLFFIRKKTRDLFGFETIGIKRLDRKPKIFVCLLISSYLILFLISHSLILYTRVKYKDNLSIVKLQPKKVGYTIKDENFISSGCRKINIFHYSIYVPKDWKIAIVGREKGRASNWRLNFKKIRESHVEAFMVLESEGVPKIWEPTAKTFRFRSVYDFEKMLYSSTWRPLFLTMKITALSNLSEIEDITSSNWKGFAMIVKRMDKRNTYDYSLYDINGKESCSIFLGIEDSALTQEQAETIISTLKFENIPQSSKTLFEEGKIALLNGDFSSATINFINALYADKKNVEYAFYLAKALYEDTAEEGRKERLHSSKEFLEYSIQLDPSYKGIRELLLLVDKEMKKIDMNKKD